MHIHKSKLDLMASSIFLASQILSLILFHLTEPTCSVPTSFQSALTRVRSTPLKNGPTDSLIKSPMKASRDVYTMLLAIGTPPVKFWGVMDTGSDLIWTKCKGPGQYDRSKSTSFSKAIKSCSDYGLGQGCEMRYQDEKTVSVDLGQDTLTDANGYILNQNVTFACGIPSSKDTRWDGIVGMGRGELSLVSQLKVRVFSYCLGSRFGQKTRGVFLAGSKATPDSTNTQTTPLLQQEGKPYYYVSLEGISVGETKLAVTKSDFAISEGGGMIIDSGTTFTYLEERIIDMIADAFMNQTSLEKYDKPYYQGLKHCFKLQPSNVPDLKMVFHFEGANWELPKDNYIYRPENKDVACLAFIANNSNEKVSVFGNMQQQNMMVTYNVDENSLLFKPVTNCDL